MLYIEDSLGVRSMTLSVTSIDYRLSVVVTDVTDVIFIDAAVVVTLIS